MSVRADLLGLTRPALVALANAGFVKRAEKELEQAAPTIGVADDGTLTATFADGTVTKLPPGVSLQQSPCTCGATPMCRHRVMAVLAYQKNSEAPAAPAPSKPWSPADIDDAALEKALGKTVLARAANARQRGVLADVHRGTFAGDDMPAVHMSTSSVRFLVAGDVAHARCDCTLRTGCEHVALAVWAFRLAAEKDPTSKVVAVEVLAASAARVDDVSAAIDLAASVLLEGAINLGPGAATRFALARRTLERAGYSWPLAAVDDLEALLDAYRRRSALYSPEELAGCVAEIVARARAAAKGTDVPSRAVLGADEAIEARLDQLRLVALGARVRADGDDRQIRVFFADPSSDHVTVLERRAPKPEGGQPEDGVALAARSVLAGNPLSVVATCQLVSNAAIRRANRVVTFSTGALKQTSVLRGPGTLDALPQNLVVRDLERHRAATKNQAPRWLRPRLAASTLIVLAVSKVSLVAYDAAAQAVVAECLDATENPFTVRLAYRAECPAALHVLAKALSGNVTGVIGTIHGDVVEPITVVTDRFVAIDLEKGEGGLAALPHVSAVREETPLGAAVSRTLAVLEGGAHTGLRTVSPAWTDRLRQAREEVRELGLEHLAADLEALDHALLAARATGSDSEERAAANAWVTVSLRAQLIAGIL